MKEAPPFSKEGSTKRAVSQGPSREIKDLIRLSIRFKRELRGALNGCCDAYLEYHRAKRVAEKREANRKLDLAKQELEKLVRDGMKRPTTGIVIYDKLNGLLNQVIKHRASVQYLILDNIEEAVRHFPLGAKQ